MAKYKIPDPLREGFSNYLELTDAQREKIKQTISDLPAGYSLDEMAKALSEKVNDIEEGKLHEIYKVLLSLHNLIRSEDEPSKEVVSSIVQALKEQLKIKVPAEFEKHLFDLFEPDNLWNVNVKASELLWEREKILVSTRAITDFRPVFSDNKDCKIQGWIIIHNLRITFNENSEEKEIFLALDSNDLEKLKDVVLRATAKEKTIREDFGKTNQIIKIS